MSFEKVEDLTVLARVEFAREQVGAECQAQGIRGTKHPGFEVDNIMGHPVDGAQVVIHDHAMTRCVHHQRLKKTFIGNETVCVEFLI